MGPDPAGRGGAPDVMTPAERRPYALWTGVALVWIVSGGLYLLSPPSLDQFNQAYLGWRWIRGEVPYRDVIDMNWPAGTSVRLDARISWIPAMSFAFSITTW